MDLTEINKREKKFHNDLQSKEKVRFENIFYKCLFNLYNDFDNYLSKNVKNKVVLDYGCGVGSITQKISTYKPSKIVGIDISEVSITKANASAKTLNLNIDYKVDNCENSSLHNNTFDLIYGTGILHHLKLKDSAKEICRLLKKNGEMIFVEPQGTNPIINIYRKLTPKSRSVDEHPFLTKDFNYLKSIYKKVTIKYYGFLTLIFFPFYKNPDKSKIFKVVSYLDQKLFKIKIFRLFAWSVLIICKKD